MKIPQILTLIPNKVESTYHLYKTKKAETWYASAFYF